MAKVYRAVDAQGAEVTYQDRKRAWWLLSAAYPLIPATGVLAHAITGAPVALALPLGILYGLMPLLDFLVGEDPNNPPEEVVPQLEEDPYYRWLTWLAVPLHFVTLLACAWWVGTQALPWWGVLLTAYAAGAGAGLGINTGHELGHKRGSLEQWLTRLVLAVPAYGHFTVEHNRGHHKTVATPEDCASARLGETIYRFALRELPGGVARAWRLEGDRLRVLGRSRWSVDNTMLQSYLVTAVLQVGLWWTFGLVMLPFLAVHNAAAWWQLTSANYVEHYGLLRLRDAGGHRERTQPHHSWNANHLVTNLTLFHLQRHSDHHAHPSRRYQSLRDFPDLPQLPSGYPGMFVLAYLPPLWFRVMDPRVLALPQVRGDLSRANVDPRRRGRSEAAPSSVSAT
jgi:alkane 1-monooxygenase